MNRLKDTLKDVAGTTITGLILLTLLVAVNTSRPLGSIDPIVTFNLYNLIITVSSIALARSIFKLFICIDIYDNPLSDGGITLVLSLFSVIFLTELGGFIGYKQGLITNTFGSLYEFTNVFFPINLIVSILMLTALSTFIGLHRRKSLKKEATEEHNKTSKNNITTLAFCIAIGALLTFPFILHYLQGDRLASKYIDLAILILTYVMLGWGLNIVVGLAGLLDLGYVAFYAVGAYSYALISTSLLPFLASQGYISESLIGYSFWLTLPIAALLAASFGILLGFPVLRLRGDYLAIVTLAFGEIIRVILLNWGELSGGPDGIGRIPKPTLFGIPFDKSSEGFAQVFNLDPSNTRLYRFMFLYYIILALALLTNYIVIRLRKLPVGRAWEALREDEIAASSLGINIRNTKLTAFAIGAAFGGLAGSFFATRQGFISPESFTFHESALIIAIVVLGGMGSQIGVVLAAVVMIGFFEFFRDLETYRMLVVGLSIVLIMIWKPHGLISGRKPSILLPQKN